MCLMANNLNKHVIPICHVNPTPLGPAEVMAEASTKKKRDKTRHVRHTVAANRFELDTILCLRAIEIPGSSTQRV